jgi:tRNA A37 threonylcarbamoyladenosine synthetase subunit TsaC/SUA5/YrdC
LQRGGLLAHQTGTLAGVAANPNLSVSIKKLQRFKQRQSPFLLLAASSSVALQQARYISSSLRKCAKTSWPGAVTLVFAAKKGLSKACYHHGMMAIRVDADVEARRLAQLCGGLLLSSSFNRKSQAVLALTPQNHMRFSALLDDILMPTQANIQGEASHIYQITGSKIIRLR